MNTAAHFLSRLDLDPKDKFQLLIRDDIQTSPNEVHIQSSNVAEEEQYFLPDDETETEEHIWERKQRARKKILGKDTTPRPGEDLNINETNAENNYISNRNNQKKQ